MFLRKALKFGARAVNSPLLARGISGAKVVTDVLGLVGVPFASAISRGLGLAEKSLSALKSSTM